MLAHQSNVLPDLWWALLVLPLLAGARLLSRYTQITPWLYRACWFIAGVVWLSFRADLILKNELPIAYEMQPSVITGVVASLPKQTDRYTQFQFEIDEVKTEEGESYLFDGRIRLRWYGQALTLAVGDQWQLKVKMKRPHGFQNPGGFDYEAWLFSQRLRATGYVLDDVINARLSPAGASKFVSMWRIHIIQSIRAALPDDSMRGVVTALAVGDRTEITDDMWQVFRRTGTNHLIAISGLHIGLVSGLIMLLASFVWRWWGRPVLWMPAPKFAVLCGLAAGFVYAALAGFSIPTQRALLMLVVITVAVLSQRRLRPFQVLSWSLLLVLVFDPLSVMSQGFWLSFCAVAVIIFTLLMPGRKLNDSAQHEATTRIKFLNVARSLLVWGRIQIIIAIGLAPLLLLFYQHVSFAAPLANIIAIPLVGFIAVPLILFGVLCDAVALTLLSNGLFGLANFVLQWLWYGLSWFSGFDVLNFRGSQPNYWLLISGVIGVVLLFAPRGVPARWLGVLWVMPLFIAPTSALEKGTMHLTVLDVGQGLAIVVQTESRVLLFDTGAKFSQGFDAGSAVVLPYLRHERIKQIDAVVLSHNDNDHVGGMRSISEQIPVNRVLTGTPQRDFNATSCRAGDEWNWDGIHFEILWPESSDGWSENNASCVIKIDTGNGVVLLTGDIEAEAEQMLVNKYHDALQSNVLLLAHHGSNTSSTPEFVDAVNPDLAINSSGYRNRFRHPHQDVVKRLDERGISWLDTQSSGAITITINAQGIVTREYREQRPRYYY